jgi:malate permease and related proteins
MFVVETLAPLILLIALGAGLAHIKFLGRSFIDDLNKLAFWVVLPALLFSTASEASVPGDVALRLFLLLVLATLLITGLAWVICVLLRVPREGWGTLLQAAFRGNLAYIGLPVLAYSLGSDRDSFASAVIVLVLLTVVYNILAVWVLRGGNSAGPGMKRMLGSILTNPLLISGLLGLGVSSLGLSLPGFVDRALDSLGGAAVPLAVLCIGGSLTLTPLRGRRSWILAAALLKVVALPILVFGLARGFGLNPTESRIVLVLSACPTAAASYVMVRQMGGDEALATGAIALSTVLSALSLAGALAVTV